MPPLPPPTIYPSYCHCLSPTLSQWCPLHATDIHALKDVGAVMPEEVPEGWAPRIYTLFHHGNHPIKWVKIVGVVVAMDVFYGRKMFTLDDSSGACVECTAVVPVVKNENAMVGVPGHLDQGGRRLDMVVSTTTKKKEKRKGKVEGKGEGEEKELGVLNPSVPWEEIDVGTVVKIKGRIGCFRGMMQVQIVSAFVVKTTDKEVQFWDEAGRFRKEVLEREWVVSREVQEKLQRKIGRRRKREGKGGVGENNGTEEVSRDTEKDAKRKRREDEHDDGRDAAKRLLQQEARKRKQREVLEEEHRAARRVMEQEAKKRLEEEEIRKKEAEDIQERKDARAREVRRRKRKESEDAKDRTNYPSMAVRKASAGKYDLLGF